MHTRWKFRDHLNLKLRDTFEGHDPGVGRPGRKGPNISREACLDGGEKSLVYEKRCPYRKPTQVDEERILRPTGEG